MKFVTRLFSSSTDTAEIAFFTMDAATAKALLDLHARVMKLSAELIGANLANSFSISVGSHLGYFHAFEGREDLGEALGQEEVVMLTDDEADSRGFSEDSEGLVRTECARVAIEEGSVILQALAKYGDTRFETAKISLALLRKVAGE